MRLDVTITLWSRIVYKRNHRPLPPNFMKETFLKISNHDELAAFFGLSYSDLAKTLYKIGDRYKYVEFKIPKKGGGNRTIKSPCKKLKIIQKKISEILYEIYPVRPSAHGFIKDRNIIRNAEKHLDKTYIFNVDLSDFFGSIHFGRVRNLFKSPPFNFNHTVSTILAHACCFDNSLPQGAPSSPILSNMIAWKLDGQLQRLAKVTNSTYTRYVDDITFSFTCSKARLPEEIVVAREALASPGHALSKIIEENGFNINYEKVRLAGTMRRMEVTGITVNEFPNVLRKYIRQISSILHSWRKYGYEATEKDFNEKYDTGHRASDKPKSLAFAIKGKLSFLRSVRGGRDEIFNKLARQYNKLVEEEELKFQIFEIATSEATAVNALWVIEVCYDDESGESVVAQGTGFSLANYGLVTCAHVVSEKGKPFVKIDAFKCTDTTKKYKVKVKYLDTHRDIAICEVLRAEKKEFPTASILMSEKPIEHGLHARLLGFPAYKMGQTHYITDAKVASIFPHHGLQKFEIDSQIREGNSGGPIINEDGQLIGVVLEGALKNSGNNAALCSSELQQVINGEENKI